MTDFGIASAVPLTQTGFVVGTAYYLSPEQAAGRSGSPASDVYGLGVVAYECLAGVRPFRGDNPVAVALAHLREEPPPLAGSVPPQVRELVGRAMAKDPEHRFEDAATMAATARSLRTALADGTLPARHGTADEEGGLAALPVEPPVGVTAPTGRLELPEPRHAPGSRSRSARSAVRLVLALLVVLSLGLGVRTMLTAPADVPAAGTALGPGSRVQLWLSDGPETVPVEASAYVGLPAVEVRAALASLGLVPRLAYDGDGTPVGTVSSVDPVGALPVSSEVVVHVVPEPKRGPDRQDPPGQGKGRGST